MKFKVGDIVRGKENSSSRYGVTNEDMYKGKIIRVADDDYIDIEILDHKDKEKIGRKYVYLNPEYFKLLREYTYEDLKKSPIGTKVTFEDGTVLVKNGSIQFESPSSVKFIDELKNLESKLLGKIIKIEEPTYTTVYENKVEVLDEVEKRYLKNIIRPFRDKVEYITKTINVSGELEHINIIFRRDTGLIFPNFEKGTMYKGMEIGKQYTLSELGL